MFSKKFYFYRWGDGCLNVLAFLAEILLFLFFCIFGFWLAASAEANNVIVTYRQSSNHQWVRIVEAHYDETLYIEFEDEILNTENYEKRYINYKAENVKAGEKPVVYWYDVVGNKNYVRGVYVILNQEIYIPLVRKG